MNNQHIFHVIKDPVHGTMQFNAYENRWVKPFIDSANFQRLRHIKQLGLGDYIFPGAVHSRFNHSIGCAYIAGQIAHKIGLNDHERQLVMVASLLHDIGHGPFSHAFEDIFIEKIIRHETWTPYFLRDYTTSNFFNSYNQHNPEHPLSFETFKIVEQMIMHTSPNKSVLGDIVSSQLDADRLDYLLRDSHFCGVRYGEYDFRWMLHCLAIVPHQHGKRLGITYKGIGVVEHYLMARRLMLNNIYRSHKKLAIEALLIQLLSLLAKELNDHNTDAPLANSRLGQFLIAVNQFNQKLTSAKDRESLKQTFLAENFQHYKALCDYDVFWCVEQIATLANHPNSDIVQIAKRLHQRIMPKIVRIDYANFKEVAKTIANFKEQHQSAFADWQLLLIQIPHQAYSGEEDPILVFNEYGEINPIEHYSFMMRAIEGQLEHVAFLAIDRTIANDKRILSLIRAVHENSEKNVRIDDSLNWRKVES